MVFITDPACPSREIPVSNESWVSYGETGDYGDKMIGVFRNKPTYSESDGKYFDEISQKECEVEFECAVDSQNQTTLEKIIGSLLPPLKEIRGTKKLLHITIDIVDQ